MTKSVGPFFRSPFSLWGLDLARAKTHRLKPAPQNAFLAEEIEIPNHSQFCLRRRTYSSAFSVGYRSLPEPARFNRGSLLTQAALFPFAIRKKYSCTVESVVSSG